MNKLCKDYAKLIKINFKHLQPIIIFYGSNIYNTSSSDLDVCLVFDAEISKDDKIKIVNDTKEFQQQNNLNIDEEIPFENKLIYTVSDLMNIFCESPFRTADGKYKIDPITKSKEFLSSKIMRQRLMLNILTTDHKYVNDNKHSLKKYEVLAWKEILKLLLNLFNTNILDAEKVLCDLYTHPLSGEFGEMYLGYKTTNEKKQKYLKKKAKKYVKNLYKTY